MDFKSLISKLDSMETPPKAVAAPTLPQNVQLNEDAQLRVLSGRTTYVAEAKKKAEEDVKEEMKTGDKKPSSTGGTIEKTATGIKHHAGKNYGGSKAETDNDDEDDKASKKKAKKESIEPEFKSKFMKMVEAKKSGKKKPDDDNDGVPNWADKKKGEDDNADKKKGAAPKKGVNPFAKKVKNEAVDPAKEAERHAKQAKGIEDQKAKFAKEREDGTRTGPKVDLKKRPVKESVETKLSFRDMMKLVVESGGQQQIDPIDAELFAWAQRVAASKYTEGTKADVFAGMLYERNGGVFEMYDVLSEDQK